MKSLNIIFFCLFQIYIRAELSIEGIKSIWQNSVNNPVIKSSAPKNATLPEFHSVLSMALSLEPSTISNNTLKYIEPYTRANAQQLVHILGCDSELKYLNNYKEINKSETDIQQKKNTKENTITNYVMRGSLEEDLPELQKELKQAWPKATYFEFSDTTIQPPTIQNYEDILKQYLPDNCELSIKKENDSNIYLLICPYGTVTLDETTLNELGTIDYALKNLNTTNKQSNGPNLYNVKYSSQFDIYCRYGKKSNEYKITQEMILKQVSMQNNDLSKKFSNNNVLTSLLLYNLSNSKESVNTVKSSLKDSTDNTIKEEDIKRYQIILWFSIGASIVLYVTFYMLACMKYDTDQQLFGTVAGMKPESKRM